ncbi:hypothetical protein BCR32DRAFT_266852 [Anaeromyces robustus]|uniref:RGS domain-containing protein n=1 Tax=Anaeromyces robustus TaxID=1754192 RepID=A0A1Y1XD08_9FUNG|nr:hypothetical protein BCR32DRAFT_266852 [Anaeromyces robustus]|eukprot:ORX83628.1 hypothetical protein BCR32DRAFT_266852 [Anaeromyces robustus]
MASDRIPFPSEWDSDSVGASDYYERCYPYVEKEEDFYDIAKISPIFIVFAILCILGIIGINLWLMRYYKSYIFKRQCRTYYLCLMVGSLTVMIDTFLLELYYEKYPCILHHTLTGIGYPLYLGSIGLIIIKYYKYYYKSQIAYFKSFLEFLDDKHNETLQKKFYFKYFYTNISSKKALRILIVYIFINLLYSNLMYFVDDRVKAKGFCVMRYSYTPQILEFVFFLFLFLPLALLEALKFDDKFKMKKTIIMSTLLHIIYFTGFFLESLVIKINCSIIVQYIPPGFFVFLSCITSTLFLSLSMLNDIIYLNKCNKNLKGTYKGMIEMLENKILFREFGEFCRNENCVENILFFQEYWKYKKLFNKNDKSVIVTNPDSATKSQDFSDTHSAIGTKSYHEDTGLFKGGISDRVSSIIVSSILNEPAKTDFRAYLTTIENEAKKFCSNFIGSKALYEINIQNFIVTSILDKMKSLQDDDDQSFEEKVDEYYSIFDRAYKEVTNNIYLNSYSNYVHQKNKEQKEKTQKSRSNSRSNSNMC